jgi:hypothetical protein
MAKDPGCKMDVDEKQTKLQSSMRAGNIISAPRNVGTHSTANRNGTRLRQHNPGRSHVGRVPSPAADGGRPGLRDSSLGKVFPDLNGRQDREGFALITIS